jgi:hypothetical protein
MVYIFDKSSFKVLGNYFPKSFPTVWQKIDLIVSEGKLQSVREVLKEVEYGNNKQFVLDWIDSNKQIFLPPTAQETLFIPEIFSIRNFNDLVSEKARLQGKPVADPFIIACAKIKDGCVITEEALKPNAAKIPTVCQHFSIDCTNVQEIGRASCRERVS